MSWRGSHELKYIFAGASGSSYLYLPHESCGMMRETQSDQLCVLAKNLTSWWNTVGLLLWFSCWQTVALLLRTSNELACHVLRLCYFMYILFFVLTSVCLCGCIAVCLYVFFVIYLYLYVFYKKHSHIQLCLVNIEVFAICIFVIHHFFICRGVKDHFWHIFFHIRSCQGSRQLVMRGMPRGIEAWHFGGEANHHMTLGNIFVLKSLNSKKMWCRI